jgi:hypothetical protein
MYDQFDDYFYPAEDNYHEYHLQMQAEEFYNGFFGRDNDQSEVFDVTDRNDDDCEDLLDELEYPF